MQFSGMILGLAMFVGIWVGHVGVRWLEARSVHIGPPALALFVLGAGLNLAALFGSNLTLAGLGSVLGFIALYSAIEVGRQAWRVQHSHAPANPRNPRHAAYLRAGKGTTVDLLKRDPLGVPQPIIADELPAPPQHIASDCLICGDPACVLGQRGVRVTWQTAGYTAGVRS